MLHTIGFDCAHPTGRMHALAQLCGACGNYGFCTTNLAVVLKSPLLIRTMYMPS